MDAIHEIIMATFTGIGITALIGGAAFFRWEGSCDQTKKCIEKILRFGGITLACFGLGTLLFATSYSLELSLLGYLGYCLIIATSVFGLSTYRMLKKL